MTKLEKPIGENDSLRKEKKKRRKELNDLWRWSKYGVSSSGILRDAWHPVIALVEKQAEDEGLWFIAQTAPEAYLQQELRRLHGSIEAAKAAQTKKE